MRTPRPAAILGIVAGALVAALPGAVDLPSPAETGAGPARGPAMGRRPVGGAVGAGIAGAAGMRDRSPRLLFITLDGVRSDEMIPCVPGGELFGKCRFGNIRRRRSEGSFEIFGMKVGNSRNLSLPGYHTIYTGLNPGSFCVDNSDCSRPYDRTWLEQLRYAYGALPNEVAAIASWSKMAVALEKDPGNIRISAGVSDMLDPRTNEVPPALRLADRLQRADLPRWENARRDDYTFEYARWYLSEIRPRALVVGFLDTDELAHEDRKGAYLDQIEKTDGWIERLLRDLEAQGELDRTIVMITTDHGRGDTIWTFRSHGPEWYNWHSDRMWFAVSVPPRFRDAWDRVKKDLRMGRLTQRDIRRIVEALAFP